MIAPFLQMYIASKLSGVQTLLGAAAVIAAALHVGGSSLELGLGAGIVGIAVLQTAIGLALRRAERKALENTPWMLVPGPGA